MKQSKEELLKEFDKSFVYKDGGLLDMCYKSIPTNSIGRLRKSQAIPIKDFISKAIDSAVKETAIRAQELAKAQIMDKEELKIAQKIGIDSNVVIEAICNLIDNDIIQTIRK